MDSRATAWSVTLNMKTIPRDKCEEYIGRARQNNWNVEGQIEQGEQGTQHYQLLVRTPQVRFSAVKKMFPTAHIEVCRNVAAMKNYVHKEETRVEELKSVENKYVSWKDVRDKFYEWVVEYGEAHAEHDYDRLRLWDQFIGESWMNGIECDIIGVNPQYRSCILKFWKYGVLRQTDRQTNISIDRQTDRQTQIVSVPIYTTNEGSSLEA